MTAELYTPGYPITPAQYVTLETHYYSLLNYVDTYLDTRNTYNPIKKQSVHALEFGSDSKKTSEKHERLKIYLSELSNFLHRQSELVFPLLSDQYKGETI